MSPKFADLKGPRWNIRKFRSKIISRELYKEWKKNNSNVDFDTFKRIWKMIAKELQETVISEPDGVMLPHGIGDIYLGYVKLKEKVVDYKTSKQHNTIAYFDNFHSYGKAGKIIYYPCGKYKMSTCKMWNFRAITPFKEKTVEALREYPERYKNSRQKNKYGNSSNRTSDISANESS